MDAESVLIFINDVDVGALPRGVFVMAGATLESGEALQ
jgi:hypothetical protein